MQLKPNLKIKKHIARVLSLAIAMAIAFTSLPANTLTVHAGVGDSGDNTGGGGGNMSGSTSALAWSQNHQGYRMYIIDENFIRISPTYDFYYSTPSAGTYCWDTRFDGPSSPTEYYYADISKLKEWCDSPYDVPAPTKLVNGNRIGNGQEFKEWFFAGQEGTRIPGRDNSSGGGNNGGNTGNPTNQSYNNTVITSMTVNWSDFIAAATSIECGDALYDAPPTYMNPITYNALVTPKVEAINTIYTSIYNRNSSEIGKWFDYDGDGVGDDQITASELKKYCQYLAINGLWRAYPASNQAEYVSCAIYIFLYGEQDFFRICDVSDDLPGYEEDWAHLNTTNNLLTQNIPLAGEGGGEGMPAYNLINKNNTIVVPGYISPYDALRDGCYLVVEPITWLYVRTNNGPWDSPSTYESTRTYGTYWNLASKWVGTGGFYNTIMTKLFNNCLAISRTVTSPTGKTLQGIESTNQKSVADSLNYMNAGYGLSMHIYDSSDFASSTSTYDEPLGSTPGKAPDDSDQLPEADRTNTAKYANIVKFYESENSVTINNQTATQITRDSFTRTPSPKTILIEDEIPTGYVVAEWYTSQTYQSASGSTPVYENYKASMSSVQSGTNTGSIELGDNETTLYVLLVKSSASRRQDRFDSDVWILNESEIAKPVSTGNRVSSTTLSFTLGTLESCDTNHLDCSHSCNNDCAGGDLDCNDTTTGHTHDASCYEDEYCGHSHGTGCYKKCDSYTLQDSSLTFKLKNTKENDYPKVIAVSYGTSNNTVSGTRTLTTAETLTPSGFNYSFVIYRGDDTLNYAGYKNNVNHLGFTAINSKTSRTRKIADYHKFIALNLTNDSTDLDTSASGNRHGTTYFTDTATTSSVISFPFTTPPSADIDNSGRVQINVYSGNQSLTPHQTVLPDLLMRVAVSNASVNMTAGRQVSSNGSFKFNPYIRMTHQKLGEAKQDVFVLGEYQRTIYPNDYAEIDWELEEGNLKILSQQWSLDVNHTNNTEAWRQKNSVLKGGATYSLETDKKTIRVNSYQAVVGDPVRSYSTFSGTNQLTESEAITAHNQFVQSVAATLDATNVAQYVNTDFNASKAYANGLKVEPGCDISSLNNGSSLASTDSKYYIRDNDYLASLGNTPANNNAVKDAQRGDFETYVDSNVSKTYYRFYSDTSGNIYMASSSSLSGAYSTSGTVILTKSQGADALTGTAQALNTKTAVVTKLIESLERNAGNDTTASWASDGKWYNEAFDGIVIMVQSTKIDVMFNNTKTRVAVLDPKLIPEVNGKSDQGTTAFLMQYYTDLTNSTPVGQFKGNDVYMHNATELFNTRKVYITNMTVQDTK